MLIPKVMTNGNSAIAEAFSLHFSQTPDVLSSFSAPETPALSQPCSSSFTFTLVSSCDVQQAISQLSSSSGPGPDGIEDKYIKLDFSVLSSPLAEISNLSYNL